jgi:phospholipid-binding lipoprotein MlaA
MRGARAAFTQAVLAASLVACASASGPGPFNHAMFSVNDALDRWLIGPVARGWIAVTPKTVRVHLDQFYDNLNFPGYFVQPLLQGDPRQSGIALARFGINSTAGLAGFFDPANHWLGLARRAEDTGQTFGVWGSGPGPYLVLPVLLPASDVRDAAGFPFDSVLNIGDSAVISYVVPGIWPATLLRTINRRALVDEDLRELREASFDWYSSVRDAYLQRRRVLIRNERDDAEEAPHDDLYEIDEIESPSE